MNPEQGQLEELAMQLAEQLTNMGVDARELMDLVVTAQQQLMQQGQGGGQPQPGAQQAQPAASAFAQ